MYVQHPVMDDAETGFYRFLSLASHCHSWQYSIVRPDYDLFDVSLSLDLHEPVHRRADADRSLDTNDLYQAFPVHEEVSAIRHRLAGRCALGCLTCRNRFPLQLWRLV